MSSKHKGFKKKGIEVCVKVIPEAKGMRPEEVRTRIFSSPYTDSSPKVIDDYVGVKHSNG